MLSRASRMACIASRCSGRKSEKPHTRWSASFSRESASGVGMIDVVINETLKFRREFVVGAVQGLDVLAVDEHRAAGLFAGARQGDADAGGLRLAGTVDHAAHDRQRHLLDALVRRLPRRHHLADVVLNPLGELLKRAAGGAAAAGAGGDARRE